MISHVSRGTYIYELKNGSWELFEQIPSIAAFDMVYCAGRLYAGCHNGLWYLELEPTDVGDGPAELSANFALGQNYPNSFNPSTEIPLYLAARTHVRLVVFGLLGRKVATLHDGTLPAGNHTVVWTGTAADGRPVASGVYLYWMQAGEEMISRKMLLVK